MVIFGESLYQRAKDHRAHLTLLGLTGFLCLVLFAMWRVWMDAETKYQALLSDIVYDRSGVPLLVAENSKGHYVLALTKLPEDFQTLLIKKEDRYFFYHPGVNPISTLRAIVNYLSQGKTKGASTITQQLAKNLLGTETKRNLWNKVVELVYALSIELFTTKTDILLMYANSVYLGNQLQGFATASHAYFNKTLRESTHSEKISLLATLSYPSTRNPWGKDNAEFAAILNQTISPEETFIMPLPASDYSFQRDSGLELSTAGIKCEHTCTTTIDDPVTQAIRTILDRHINKGWNNHIRNGAVVVIDPKTEEVIALIGSRDPRSSNHGDQINMAIKPRPIGSTIKPFIYAKGFADGLRPYSMVEDREYKYPIATGFSLYPKNYDGQYRGELTLHEALSNSLNVPAVKTLEYIGLENFYAFLSDNLRFEPIQDYGSYQYGIALGGLEMDLLTLTHYFSIFPRAGTIAPLRILQSNSDNFELPPQSNISKETRVVPEEAVSLINVILSDRLTGVNQFGLKGNLNLSQSNYGVKTGTSRDFHDSWVVGYTGDLVVGVWVGNSENQAMNQVSGSSGAGAIWHDIMEYLFSTPYNKQTSLPTDRARRISIDGTDEWGLTEDIVSEHRDLLREDNLILQAHPGDIFKLTDDLVIPLRARKPVTWSVNGEPLETTAETRFTPKATGAYEISARTSDGKREIIMIEVINEQ